MDKQTISRQIAMELLDNDMLNVADFNGDTHAALEETQKLIFDRIKDYYILVGNVF